MTKLPSSDEGPRRCRPVIDSEWRVLFRPSKCGKYVNDHSVIRAADGTWHLYGITAQEANPEQERYFVHAAGPSLWSETPMQEHGAVCNDGTRAWAPCVVAHGKQYVMLYGPSPTKCAVSRDLGHWIGTSASLVGAPPEACHRDHMVFQIEPSTWLMYGTGIDEDGLGMISLFISNDLFNWRYVRPALRTRGEKALRCSWGATESPFVVYLDGWYYLSITYTDCNRSNYSDTVVFRSSHPYDFGVYDLDHPADDVTKITAHAPEYIHDPATDSWYITTCGWPGFGIPHEGAVSIAKLKWVPC